jgi:hypothetical protein
MEHERRADEMEHDAQRMEHDSGKVGDRIEEARGDWHSKEQDQSVPGAQPATGEEEDDGS